MVTEDHEVYFFGNNSVKPTLMNLPVKKTIINIECGSRHILALVKTPIGKNYNHFDIKFFYYFFIIIFY